MKEQYQYLLNSFGLEGHISFYDVNDSEVKKLQTHRLRMIFLFSPIKINVTPSSLKDI